MTTERSSARWVSCRPPASDGAPAALLVEPVISAGGVIVPPEGYFEELRRACDARGMLLIYDEAQRAFLHVIESGGFSSDGLACVVTDGGSLAMELMLLGVAGPQSRRPVLLHRRHVAEHAARRRRRYV